MINSNTNGGKENLLQEVVNAEILEASEENIKICANKINDGMVVGFPTETVYGLGANALNIDAVKKIFEYKGRPLSDPLIVHVTSIEMAKELTVLDEETYKLFTLLADKFWPGPLTMVLKANFEVISPILTANTQYIGIRYPKNEIAKKLIEYSKVPIAAPSANKFCHVSPVNPVHVFEDFKEFPVTILNGGVCNLCMESTVIKIVSEEKKIQILRMGAISPDELKSFLETSDNCSYSVEIFKKVNQSPNQVNPTLNKDHNSSDKKDFELDQEAPGQFIKHYSPKLDTFILDEDETENILKISKLSSPSEIVFIDYAKLLFKKFSDYKFTNFFELSEKSSPEEVMLNLYDYLRAAEKVEGAKVIVLCDLHKYMLDNPHKVTLVDRVLKAAAFRKINLKI